MLRDKIDYHVYPGLVTKASFMISPEKIETIVSTYFEIPMEEICAKSRERRVTFPRQVIAYLMRKNTKLAYSAIGARLGGRDHATAIHCCRNIRNLMETDRETRKIIRKIEIMIDVPVSSNLTLDHLKRGGKGKVYRLLRGSKHTISFLYRFSHIEARKIYGEVKMVGEPWSEMNNHVKMAVDDEVYYQHSGSEPEIIYIDNQKLKKC